MSVSFAILGFSFQDKLAPSTSLAIRISGLLIYWFAYLMFQRFFDYNRVLRTYLLEMEKSGRTFFYIQGRTNVALRALSNNLASSVLLLLYFGLLYIFGLVVLWLLGLC